MSSWATSSLPIYRHAIDWAAFEAQYPPPDIYADTVFKWPADRIRALQNERFLKIMAVGWNNPFYRGRWSRAGLSPGDIRSVEDIRKLPIFNTEDVKDDQESHPPYGTISGVAPMSTYLLRSPTRVQSSGGTTGKPRMTLNGPEEWEMAALSTARGFYIQGARPGDIMQIPATCSLGMLPWGVTGACRDYLGILPLTTGSGVVTPARRQLEIAFHCNVNCWMSFPEYLMRLAQSCREELGRDILELKTKFITSFLGADVEGSLRTELQETWGCPVYDNYGTNEIGLGAFECSHQAGLHFLEDLHFFEILNVDTNQPVKSGEVGNLVVTSFHRGIHPIIRFNLRDLCRVIAVDTCACGSNFRRMDHLLGRSDNMVRIRGVNVYPMACLPAVKSDTRTTGEWLCEAFETEKDGRAREEMIVHIEVRKDAQNREELETKLQARLKSDLGVSVQVKLVNQGAIQSEGHLGEGKVGRLLDRRPGIKRAP